MVMSMPMLLLLPLLSLPIIQVKPLPMMVRRSACNCLWWPCIEVL
uniref:Uncharacterized protein n=1 Tax=Picea glauca TaxID=3330 RepID=A0A117NHN6_PICGL|nr:hypothetical protein ABT39_MTgene4693 [Picea glauca]QHR90961.1 hypothetical protein Q903MT_gene4990 [Picea sitchensis]